MSLSVLEKVLPVYDRYLVNSIIMSRAFTEDAVGKTASKNLGFTSETVQISLSVPQQIFPVHNRHFTFSWLNKREVILFNFEGFFRWLNAVIGQFILMSLFAYKMNTSATNLDRRAVNNTLLWHKSMPGPSWLKFRCGIIKSSSYRIDINAELLAQIRVKNSSYTEVQ